MGRKCRLFARSTSSPDSQIDSRRAPTGESLRPHPRIFPFCRDCRRRPGSIKTAACTSQSNCCRLQLKAGRIGRRSDFTAARRSQSISETDTLSNKSYRVNIIGARRSHASLKWSKDQGVSGAREVYLCALELCPTVFPMIGRIGAPDHIGGRPRLVSNRAKASNGDVVNTPPKSQITASIIVPLIRSV
jgi:hypothetical protein